MISGRMARWIEQVFGREHTLGQSFVALEWDPGITKMRKAPIKLYPKL